MTTTTFYLDLFPLNKRETHSPGPYYYHPVANTGDLFELVHSKIPLLPTRILYTFSVNIELEHHNKLLPVLPGNELSNQSSPKQKTMVICLF